MKKIFLFPAYLLPILAVTACSSEDGPKGGDNTPTPFVTRVIDYRPAVGQFTNQLPEYEEGDTQEDMNRKALAAIGGEGEGMVTLGGFGGYIIVGFDHTIENKSGLCDFRVLGNAFYANGQSDYGSCEPGVIMVSYDANHNNQADDPWYEIAGSSHLGGKENWIDLANEAGNDTKTIANYEITYFRPEQNPDTATDNYIRWEDNQGNSGYKAMNSSHKQPYYPQWIKEDKITFKGTRLPQNGIDLSKEGKYYALYRFRYGYADNELNSNDASAIDIDWAVDGQGNPVNLPGVDFIKIYTGVNQENGWLGECSTEITGVVDLHLTQVEIKSSSIKQ